MAQPETTAHGIELEGDAIKYVMPQQLVMPTTDSLHSGPVTLQIRLNRPASGSLQLHLDDTLIAERSIRSRPERRIQLKIDILPAGRIDPHSVFRLSLKNN